MWHWAPTCLSVFSPGYTSGYTIGNSYSIGSMQEDVLWSVKAPGDFMFTALMQENLPQEDTPPVLCILQLGGRDGLEFAVQVAF